MKSLLSILVLASLVSAGFLGCDAGGKTGSDSPSSAEETLNKDASYALGMLMGTNLKLDNLIPNIEEFTNGINDAMFESKTRFTTENAEQIIQQAFQKLAEQRDEESKQAESEFLEENSKKDGINITESGLQYEVITEGTGQKPDIFDTVVVHYEGALTNGTVFDSSYYRGEPIQFPLMRVIPGWAEGLQLMNIGSKYRLIIPSELGYGPQGAPPQIPPHSTLIFEVELLDIIRDETEES